MVRAQTELENARIQMDDTRIRAPVDGTIIRKQVELGTVISSPTRDVGGGSVLFTMANLDTVQIRTRIDETDIGQVTPGMPAFWTTLVLVVPVCAVTAWWFATVFERPFQRHRTWASLKAAACVRWERRDVT